MFQSVEIFTIPLLNFGLLLGAFALLLGGAEIFTNSVEWFGYQLGLSESATESILAAVEHSGVPSERQLPFQPVPAGE